MRNIVLAAMIAVGASSILYLLATALGLPSEVAKGLAGIPAFAIQKVYEFLEAWSAKRALAETGLSSMMSVKDFSMHPLSVFLLSTVMMWGVIHFIGGLMGVSIGIADDVSEARILDSQPKLFAQLIVFTSLPLKIIAAAHIGNWIGTRSRRYGLAIAIGAIALGSIASWSFSILMMSDEMFKVVAGDTRTGGTVLTQFFLLLPDMAIFIIFGAIGFWHGQRRKLAYYLAFIMKILPEETRQTIVEMAREEALRALRPTMQATS